MVEGTKQPTVLVSRRALSLRQRAKKRALDLAISVPLLVGLLPIFGVIALAIKLDSRGPIMFKQERVGRANRMFKVLKFRSMRAEESDSAGGTQRSAQTTASRASASSSARPALTSCRSF